MMRIILMFCLLFQVSLSDEILSYEVNGSVKKPGKVKWQRGVTLADAIEAAGGLKGDARLDQVTLTRSEKRYVFDLKNETHLKVKIGSGDVIEVKQVGLISKIRVGQILQLRVTGVPPASKKEIDAVYRVDPKGMVAVWKIGAIKAQGKTKAEFAKNLAAAYKKAGIFEAAVFKVFSDDNWGDVALAQITVGGQVRKPGHIIWKKGMNLHSAIQSAGGETPIGAMNRVKLYRNDKANVYDMRRKDHQGVKVYARDVVEVPAKSNRSR